MANAIILMQVMCQEQSCKEMYASRYGSQENGVCLRNASVKSTSTPPESRTARQSIDPELLTSDEAESRQRLETLAWLFDQSIKIPILNYRIGLDVIIGLFPGVGDLISAAVSTYLVSEAARLGASKMTLMRMAGHVLMDTALGSIPFIGDLFDATYKANTRNVKLLNEHLQSPHRVQKKNTQLVILIGIVIFGGALLSLVVLFLLVRWMVQLVQ